MAVCNRRDGYNGGIVGEIGQQVAFGAFGAGSDGACLNAKTAKLGAKPIKGRAALNVRRVVQSFD